MNIILFGPPGAGKGTQASFLSNEFNLFKISTGDLLRGEINKKSSLGNEIKSKIDKGLFVSDKIINDLIINILSSKKYFNRLIFDGYPRNINQARNLDLIVKKYNQKISCVLSIKADLDIITKRILARQVCSKCGLIFNKFLKPKKENYDCRLKYLETRSDDTEMTVKKRYDTYIEQTLPILKHYEDQKLLREINGIGEISLIYKEIRQIIKALET